MAADVNDILTLEGSVDWADWRWQRRHSCREAGELAALTGLAPETAAALRRVAARYPVLVTPYYLSLARGFCPSDPIMRQCVPTEDELDFPDAGDEDPLGEERDAPMPGLVHRYADRVLLILSNECAVHCRHCMRKRCWAGRSRRLEREQVELAADYISKHPKVREVLLSGGDPLLLPEDFLVWTLARLQAVANVEVLRIGSRLPVVLPQRLTSEFCALLGEHPPVWLATQFNHPRELTPAAAAACENLLRAGIPVVNQTVLLRGVNDDLTTMRELCTGLLRLRVKPYYLFHGDPVRGTMHFRTGLQAGLEIMDAMGDQASGLALPTLAFDLPAGKGKVRLYPGACLGSSASAEPCLSGCRGTPGVRPDSGDCADTTLK